MKRWKPVELPNFVFGQNRFIEKIKRVGVIYFQELVGVLNAQPGN